MTKKITGWDVLCAIMDERPESTLDDVAMVLIDHQALNNLGFTDEDQEAIVEAFYTLVQFRQVEETYGRSNGKLLFNYICKKNPSMRLSDIGEMLEDNTPFNEEVVEETFDLLCLYNFLMVDVGMKLKNLYPEELAKGYTIEALSGWDDCVWYLPVEIPCGAINADATQQEATDIVFERVFESLPNAKEIRLQDLDFELVEKIRKANFGAFPIESMEGEEMSIKQTQEYEYEVAVGKRVRFIRAE